MTTPFSVDFLKKYDLVAADFDGTLVDKSLKLSPESKNFINYILKNNLHFIIASGRPFFGVISRACRELGLNDYQIVAAGSTIFDPNSKKPVWIQQFNPKLAKELISSFLKLRANFVVETYYSAYTENAHKVEQYGPGIKFKNLDDLNYADVSKIAVTPVGTSKKVMNDVYTMVKSYKNKLHSINADSPAGPAYDLTPPLASKHFAMLELIKLINIDRERTIGIGDGYNDYPLLSACGYKVAIEGAPKELTQIADLVISREKLFSFSNNE